MTNSNIPEGSTPISTEQLFAIIGELTVQVRVLQTMLRRQLESDKDGAITQREIQNG
jgi:hypothetical protein